ncbi:hypothetical protein ABFX02_01G074000 [Erythranthe guttata]
MGGRGGKKKGHNEMPGSQPHVSTTLREESIGKKQGSVNAKTMCKLDHLKSLAAWSATEASIPSLGAFFGERLAATNEALGLRADPSSFLCERCESILQPGHNCTVRIEKRKSKKRKKSNPTTQNHVVYTCHFCSHRNLMRGTPKGYIKAIRPPKAKPPLKSKSSLQKRRSLSEPSRSIPEVNTADASAFPTMDVHNNLETSFPATPLPVTRLTLLDSKRKRKRSGAKKVAEPEINSTAENSVPASSKKRKKSWTTLKEIAQSSSKHDNGNKLSSLTIPFFI